MLKEQIKDIIKDMSTRVTRNEKHIYTDPLSGTMYQGVTSVSSLVPKEWLSAWGSKEAVKYLGYSDHGDFTVAEEMRKKISSCKDTTEYLAILTEAKGASSRKSQKAMLDGKKGHEWISSYIQVKIDGKDRPLLPNNDLSRPLQQFIEWESGEVGEWVASEAYVVHPERYYAGQLDAIYISKSGQLCLVDFKFSSHIDPEYYLQTAAYAATFEKYGVKFAKRVIVRLPKTLLQEVWKDFKYEMIPNDIEVKIVPTDYVFDRDTFFAGLVVKRWINAVVTSKKK